MIATNALVTFQDVNSMGLLPSGSTPASTQRVVTKQDILNYYYINSNATPFRDYANNRCPRYQDILGVALGNLPNFYEYDVYRASIPNANGSYFNYLKPDGTTGTILQNTYGYVGRYCMEQYSYQNNQWNIYTFTQIQACYPNNAGTSYPYPASPQSIGTNFTFSNYNPNVGLRVYDFSLFSGAGTLAFSQNGFYNNTWSINQPAGVYYCRYFLYDQSNNFVAKYGFPGYPAYRISIS